MQMNRTRVRRDRFELRGWVYSFHELRDQGRLAALLPETDEPRAVTLYSGQTFEYRKGDAAIIFPQIGWPLPGETRASQQAVPASEAAAVAVDRAEAAIEKLREAARQPLAPVSSVNDLALSPRLRALFLPDEMADLKAGVARLTAALRLEFDEVNHLILTPGAGNRILESGKTAEQRHTELSEMLTELAELGAQVEQGR